MVGASRKYCGDKCRRRALSDAALERNEGIYRMAVTHPTVSPYVTYHWRTKIFYALEDRDGPGCALCGGDIIMGLPSGPKGDDRGPSIDHIIPKSLGGSDDLENLQMAHWGCNRKKGNRVVA
jgi:5-methylcytosine-specific restriction endonuclease McrA